MQKRIQKNIIFKIKTENACLDDISLSGIGFTSHVDLKIGERIWFHNTEIEIVRKEKIPGGNRYGAKICAGLVRRYLLYKKILRLTRD